MQQVTERGRSTGFVNTYGHNNKNKEFTLDEIANLLKETFLFFYENKNNDVVPSGDALWILTVTMLFGIQQHNINSLKIISPERQNIVKKGVFKFLSNALSLVQVDWCRLPGDFDGSGKMMISDDYKALTVDITQCLMNVSRADIIFVGDCEEPCIELNNPNAAPLVFNLLQKIRRPFVMGVLDTMYKKMSIESSNCDFVDLNSQLLYVLQNYTVKNGCTMINILYENEIRHQKNEKNMLMSRLPVSMVSDSGHNISNPPTTDEVVQVLSRRKLASCMNVHRQKRSGVK